MGFTGNRFFVSNIKGIDIDRILGAAMDHLPEGCPDSIKYMFFDPEDGQRENLVAYVGEQSVSGVCIITLKARKGPKMVISLPWFASGVDVCLLFGILRVITDMYPGAVINTADCGGNCSDETADLSTDAMNDEYMRRAHCISMLLQTGEDSVMLDTINGEWTLDIAAVNEEMKGCSPEDKVMRVLRDVTEWLWFSEDQFCEALPLPESLDEAFRYVDENLSEEARAAFRAQTEDDFAADQHFGLGLYLRNVWFNHLSAEEVGPFALDGKMPAMLRELQSRGEYVLSIPDCISDAFLREYHKHLCEES